MDAVWPAVAGAILLAASALAFRRWWPRLAGIAPAARVTLIVTTVGGLIGAVFWWQDVDAAFSWNLPPLASRLLGAAGTAFGAAGLFVLERPSPARARLHALLVVVYLVPLALAILALHLDRFDFSAPIVWAFFAVVAGLSGIAAAALFEGRGPGRGGAPAAGAESAWLLAAGIALGLWGAALFLVPAAGFPPVFVWAADPLTSRLIAAMLMTVAAALLAARGDGSLLPQAHVLAAVYGVGVVAAIAVNLAAGLPWPPLYLAAFALVGGVSLAILAARSA